MGLKIKDIKSINFYGKVLFLILSFLPDKIEQSQKEKMEESSKLALENIIKLLRSSEKKFKLGNFKGAIHDKRKVNIILKLKSDDKEIIEKFREELSRLYFSKFDLIFDHKLIIDELKKNEIIKLLRLKSEEKYKKGDFKGAIKALRRSEKYLAK